MKVLILLALVTFCASIPTFLGRHLIVGEDGTVTFRNTYGDTMDFMRRVADPRKVDITLRKYLTSPVTYHLDDVTKNRYPAFEDFNQADILFDTFRPFEGTVDEESYNKLLDRIRLLVESGVFPEALLDILRTWDFERRVRDNSEVTPLRRIEDVSQGLEGFKSFWPVQKDLEKGRWNLQEDFLNNWSPVQHLQTLLQQIKEKRQFQQGLLNGEYYPQENLFQQWTPESILGRRVESLPIRDILFEQETIAERVQKWIMQQELVNTGVYQLSEQKSIIPKELIYHQRLINQEAEEIIKHLIYRHALIVRQIEELVKERQIIPKELVTEQRFIHQQVHHMLEKLTYQQAFINERIQKHLALDITPQQEYFIQQKIVYQQIQKLIQQLFVQHIYLRHQIQVLVQEGGVFPEELVLFQKMTYQQLEKFIQVLIRQFVYQQTYFHQFIKFFLQQRQTIPQEVVSQYTIIYKELLQLIKNFDFVPQDLISEQQRLHLQILFLLEQGRVADQETVHQWVPQQFRDEWAPHQYGYELTPQQLYYQRVPEKERMYFQQPEYLRSRDITVY